MAKRENFGETPPKTGMPQESNAPNAVELAVSRAVRDNLERIQRTADELHHAVNDVVSACASNKPTNALPPMLRAQASAASLAAALDVLSRFVAVSLQTGPRSPLEAQITNLVTQVAVDTPPSSESTHPSPAKLEASQSVAPIEPVLEEPREPDYELHTEPESIELTEPVAPALSPEPEFGGGFDVNRLSAEEQELHRRANRVAKVSMQDIKMLRPEAVRLGRENKDLCIRLKDDIEKAHREYDRRFKPIMEHPVDYFYSWMVEILADGKPEALGDYPYATPAQHR